MAVLLGAGLLVHAAPGTAFAATAPACAEAPNEPSGDLQPTTVATLQQAYHCILAHYYSGPKLDDRTLLVGGFKSLTAELDRRNLDRANATLPKLTGDKVKDWTAFAKVYQAVVDTLPNDAAVRQAVAAAVLNGMLDSLQDNHVRWLRGSTPPPPSLKYGLLTAFEGRTMPDIRDSREPMYLERVLPGTPVANAGLRAGDVIEALDGVPVFIDGMLTPGVLTMVQAQNAQDRLKVTVRRPATGATWTVDLLPADLPPIAPRTVSARVLDGGIAYVVLPLFEPDAADQVLAKIAQLRATTELHGLVIDVRDNGGGRLEPVAKLLGAFVHDKVFATECDISEHCTDHRTDASTPPLNLPLVVLTDSRCASACEGFSSAVKDLHLGQLVGTRTAGAASGLQVGYALGDNSVLALVQKHMVAANGEIIDRIGVAVDHQAPVTAADVSAGRDPAVDKAVSLLT